jgi:hypothetical protein
MAETVGKTELTFDIYGRKLIKFVKEPDKDNPGKFLWISYYAGNEGKSRLAEDIAVPAGLPEEELSDFLDVLFHEEASPGKKISLINRKSS